METQTPLQKLLRKLIGDEGGSAAAFARAANVSESDLSKYVRGHRQPKRGNLFLRLAVYIEKKYRVPMSERELKQWAEREHADINLSIQRLLTPPAYASASLSSIPRPAKAMGLLYCGEGERGDVAAQFASEFLDTDERQWHRFFQKIAELQPKALEQFWVEGYFTKAGSKEVQR